MARGALWQPKSILPKRDGITGASPTKGAGRPQDRNRRTISSRRRKLFTTHPERYPLMSQAQPDQRLQPPKARRRVVKEAIRPTDWPYGVELPEGSMARNCIAFLLALSGLLRAPAAQEWPTPWRNDPLFQRLAATLDPVLAIDTHTHLLGAGKFNPTLDRAAPALNRSTHLWLPSMVKVRFGITVDPGDWTSGIEAISSARAKMVERLGELGYWLDHRSPTHKADIANIQTQLQGFLKGAGVEAPVRPVLASLSVPCGFTAAGLPVGLQIVGAPFCGGNGPDIGACI
jgi:hypothetical protein